jgi:cbb3-type cytochrome oxidase subunit 3
MILRFVFLRLIVMAVLFSAVMYYLYRLSRQSSPS